MNKLMKYNNKNYNNNKVKQNKNKVKMLIRLI